MRKNTFIFTAWRKAVALMLCLALLGTLLPENSSAASLCITPPQRMPFDSQALAARSMTERLREIGLSMPWISRLMPRLSRRMNLRKLSRPSDAVPSPEQRGIFQESESPKPLSPQQIERLEVAMRDSSHGHPPVNNMTDDLTHIANIRYVEGIGRWLSDNASREKAELAVKMDELGDKLEGAATLASEINLRSLDLNTSPLSDIEVTEFRKKIEDLPNRLEESEIMLEEILQESQTLIATTPTKADAAYILELETIHQRLKKTTAKANSIWEQSIGQPPRTTFPLSDLVNALRASYGNRATFHITFAENLESSNPQVQGNFQTMLSAFSNIIDNALHFAEDHIAEEHRHGRKLDELPRVELHLSYIEGLLTAKLQDNGPGISASFLAKDRDTGRLKVFESRITGRKEGTGWGTTQYYLAVRHAGGRADVYSEKGEGTTFTTRLACGTPTSLSPLRLINSEDMHHAGDSQDSSLRKIPLEFYPPDVQNMIHIARHILSQYSDSQLRQVAVKMLQEMGSGTFQLSNGEGLRDIVANRCHILAENPLQYIDELNDRDSATLARYWRAVWTWELLARLSNRYPFKSDESGSFYRLLTRPRPMEIIKDLLHARFFSLPIFPWRLSNKYEIHSDFVHDYQGERFNEASLEKAVFSWAIQNRRALELYDELFKRFSLSIEREGLRNDLTIQINGEPFGTVSRRLSYHDRLMIVPKEKAQPKKFFRGARRISIITGVLAIGFTLGWILMHLKAFTEGHYPMTAAAFLNIPKVRGFLRNARSLWGLFSSRQQQSKSDLQLVPKTLLDRYPSYSDILVSLCQSVLDSETLLKAEQENPESFEQALDIIRQNPESFFQALKVLVPATGAGVSWMANKFRPAFVAFPSFSASALQAASRQADALISGKYVESSHIHLERLLDEYSVTLTLPVKGALSETNSNRFKMLAEIGDRYVNVSSVKPPITVTFQGDAFFISPDGLSLSAPENLGDIADKARETFLRTHQDDGTYYMLVFCVKIALAAAILNQQNNEESRLAATKPLIVLVGGLALGWVLSHLHVFTPGHSILGYLHHSASSLMAAFPAIIFPIHQTAPTELYQEDLEALANLLARKDVQNWKRRGGKGTFDFSSNLRKLRALAREIPIHARGVELLLNLFDTNPDLAARLTFWLSRYKHHDRDADPVETLSLLAKPGWSHDFSDARLAIVQAGSDGYPPDPVPQPKTADLVVLEFLNSLIASGTALPDSVTELLSEENARTINSALPAWRDEPLRSVKQLESVFGIPITRGLLSAIHTTLARSQTVLQLSRPTHQETALSLPKEISTAHLRELAIMMNRIEEPELEAARQNGELTEEMEQAIRPLLDRYYTNLSEFELAAQQAWALTPEQTALRLNVVLEALEYAWPRMGNKGRLRREDPEMMPPQNRRTYLNNWIGENVWIADLGERVTITGPLLTNEQAPAPRLMRQHGMGLNGGQYIRLSVIGKDSLVHICEVLPGWKPSLRPGRASPPLGIKAQIPITQAFFTTPAYNRASRTTRYSERSVSTVIPKSTEESEQRVLPEPDQEPETTSLPELEKRVLLWAQTKEAEPQCFYGPVQQRNGEWKLEYVFEGRPMAALTYRFDSSSLGLFINLPESQPGKGRYEHFNALLLEILSYYPRTRYISIQVPTRLTGWLTIWSKPKAGLFSHISYTAHKGTERTVRGPLMERALEKAIVAIQPYVIYYHRPIPASHQLPASEDDSLSTPQAFEHERITRDSEVHQPVDTELAEHSFLDPTEWRSGELVLEESLGPVIITGFVHRKEASGGRSIASVLVGTGALVLRSISDFHAKPLSPDKLFNSERKKYDRLMAGKPLQADDQKRSLRDLADEDPDEVSAPVSTPVVEPEAPEPVSLMSIASQAFKEALIAEGITDQAAHAIELLRQANPRVSIFDFIDEVFSESPIYSRKIAKLIEAASSKLGVLDFTPIQFALNRSVEAADAIDPTVLANHPPTALAGWDAETVARLITAGLHYSPTDESAIAETGLLSRSEWDMIRQFVFPEAHKGYGAIDQAIHSIGSSWDSFEWALQALEEVEESKLSRDYSFEHQNHALHETNLERAS